MRVWIIALLAGYLVLLCPGRAQAQLAKSFYNLTGIQTQVLPNAVQITLQTDGAVVYGTNMDDIINTKGDYSALPVSSLRIRLLHCRSAVPSLLNIGKYPVDFASVGLGDEPLSNPFFLEWSAAPGDPRVDVTLHFYVPVLVQRFLRDSQPYYLNNRFNDYLRPLEVEVRKGDDQQSILITVITDRMDRAGAGALQRSPAADQNHHLNLSLLPDGRVDVDALHENLSDFLDAFSAQTQTEYSAGPDTDDVDISAHLDEETPSEVIGALAASYDLSVARSDPPGYGFRLIHGSQQSVSLPLFHLAPDEARLLFPDFLLPSLKTDSGNNALVVTGTPALVDHVRQDLLVLDQPASQVKVSVEFWQLQSEDDLNSVLSIVRTVDRDSESINTSTGQSDIVIGPDQVGEITAALEALKAKQRARLKAEEYVVATSGKPGSIFSGQTRNIQVLENEYGGQTAVVQPIPIGYSLKVTPTVALDEIGLSLDIKISTLDSLAIGTGLPTIGVQEVISQVQIVPGDSVILAGFDLDQDQTLTGETEPEARISLLRDLATSPDNTSRNASLLMLISARKVD